MGWMVFLPRHYIISAMISFNLNSLASLSLHYPVFLLGQFSYHLRLPRPILFLWASSTRFIPFGLLGPSHFFLLLTFSWAFAISFALSWLNYHIFYFWVYWLLNQSHLLIPFFGLLWPIFTCFLLLMIGLTTSFFGDPLGPFAFFGAL